MLQPLHHVHWLEFDWRTAVLTVAVAQLALLAVALVRTLPNRSANGTLAVLLCVLALMVMPWLIGFAGFYDKWMWLTFAPFQITLAVAPLCWLYLLALTEGVWPPKGWRPLIGYFPEVLQPDAGLEPDQRVTNNAQDIAAGYDRVMDRAGKTLLRG